MKINKDETGMESDKNEIENGEKETIEIPEITTDEFQNAIKKLKGQQWNQSRRHKSMRRRNERNDETYLQRNRKAK